MTPIKKRRVIIGSVSVAVVLFAAAAAYHLHLKQTAKGGVSTLSLPIMTARGFVGAAASSGEAAYDSYDDNVAVKSMIAPSPMPPIYQNGGQTAAEVDQKIIKNGSLRLTVDSVSDSLAQMANIAKKYQGFVQASSSSERGDGKHEGSVAIRVPSDRFESAMSDAKKIARVVNNEYVSGQDVTEQYSDLEAQLRNAQAQEAEYLVILKKAVSVEDILKVQQPLGQVRGEIESLQGRLKYLQNVTSLSSIDIALTEEASVSVPTKEFRPLTIVKQAAQTLVTLAQDIAAAIIWIVIVGGGIAIPIIVLVLLVLAALRRRGKKK